MQLGKNSLLVIALAASLMLLSTAPAQATGLLANWTLNDGGTVGNTIAAGATIADSGPNGYTGTVAGGSDTLQSVQGVIGNGLNFGGDTTSNASYVSTPTSASGTSLGGMNTLTVSMWVNIPAIPTASSTTELCLDLWDGGTSPVTCYKLGARNATLTSQNGLNYAYKGDTVLTDHGVSGGFWARGGGTGFSAGTWELLTIEYYGGDASTAVGFSQLYVNGQWVAPAETGGPTGNGAKPIPSPSSGQVLQIGYGPGREWKGGINDVGIWKTNLTGAMTFTDEVNQYGGSGTFPAVGTTGGEITALYQTPMYNGHTGALSQYGVSAMDKLFALYDTHAATTTAVTTSNGTLTWQYVASGLPGTSGFAGQIGSQYFVQLDSAGGGVETVVTTPEPSTLTLLAAGLVGLMAYAWRRRK